MDLEARIKEIAFEIFSFLKDEKPSFFNAEGWKGRVIEWSMRDEQFKTQLLRFLDVLPALKSNELVVRLFREYLHESKAAPSFLSQSAEVFARTVPAAVAAPIIGSAVRSLARQFIAGSDPLDALSSIEALWDDGASVSLDLLGEAVVSEAEAEHYGKRYLGLLDFFGPRVKKARRPDGPENVIDISLKLSSFYSQMEPLNWEGSIEKVISAVMPVVEKARSQGLSLTFDMEQYYHKDLFIAAFKQVLSESGSAGTGIALQAYLKDTENDLQGLIQWARENKQRIGIRLVKGAYWDYEVVVNRLKGWPVPVFLSKEETDKNDFEFQSLYGMGGPLRTAMKKAGLRHPARVYCPIGELLPGMAYLVRRVLENTSNESFFRKTFNERASFEELLRRPNPKEQKQEGPHAGFRNESATDFSKTDNREKMRRALARVKGSFGRRYPLFLGGEEVFPAQKTLSRNPARPDEIIGRISSASREDADRAVENARKAYQSWSKTSPGTRAEHLFRAAKEMRKRRFDLAAYEVYEVGKTVVEADSDVAEAIDYLEYYGRQMERMAGQRSLGQHAGEINEYNYEPKGITVVISPWNFPLAIPTGMTSAAIVAGNCAILKPSGLSPVIAWQLVDIFRAAGLPDNVLQYLPGPGKDVGEYLVAHPGVDMIAFTGSREVGLGIVKLAGETRSGQRSIKRVVAEMGGKNAVIIDDSADLDEAVRGILESAFVYQGQKCSACSRVIALDSVYGEFSRRLVEAVKSIEIGPPEEFGTYLGPLIDKSAFDRIKGYIELGRKEGGPIIIREVSEAGFFVGPAVFETGPDAVIAKDEIFGPVLSLMKANNFDEAVSLANRSEYALTGGVYSRSPGNIEKAKKEFMVGNLYINRKITGALVGRQPFGGFRMSGVGSKAGGPDYLLQFMNPRTISENTMRKGSAPVEEVS